MSTVLRILKLVGAIFVLLQFHLLLSNYSEAVADAKHVGCIENERHALLELKPSLVLDETSLLPSWDSKSNTCCAWEGIFCSNQTGHVEKLDLNGDQFGPFRGTIPHQLGNLSHLQYLDLASNTLVGTIPHQLGSLSNLQELYLGNNLRFKFDDKNNDVGGEWLSNLTHLTNLDLSYIPNLNSSNVWLQMIAKLPKIQELRLSDCDLSDLYLLSLSPSLLNFSTSLKILDLHRNVFASSKIFEWVFNSTSNLTELDLSTNYFKGTIPYDFGNKKNHLVRLELSGNELYEGFLESVRDICTLQSLNLNYNNLNEDISTILLKLSGCARYSLQDLSLSDNKITGTFPDLSIFPSLITIDLSSNLLSGEVLDGVRFLPPKLESLIFKFNSLEGGIPYSFCNLCSLRSLDLSRNKLREDLSVILHNMSVGCVNYSLQELDLSRNQINGTVPDMSGENWVPPFQLSTIFLSSCILGPSFPKWLESQKHLQALDISDAEISDVVPVWFWTQTTHLSLMNISYNNLTGTIPNLPISFVKPYCQVILDSNQFEGSIPPFFQSVALLRLSKNKFSKIRLLLCTNTTINNVLLLDLSKNQLSTQIPDCWSHLKALTFLDLSDNTLFGEVPSSMGSLSNLEVLILRNNSLAGKLPISLKNCTNLVMLDLGDNRLSGPIPYWLGQQLQMLSLRKNRFYGNLPHSLCNLINIQLLDLSENNLSGQIFKCLKNFFAMSHNVSLTSSISFDLIYKEENVVGSVGTFDLIAMLMWKGAERQFKNNKLILRSIDLSSNQLTGGIPEEIGNLIALVSLNLSSNNLTGKITSKIGRLTSLEFLDLSRNHFSGLIPNSLAQIDRLSMLNLSNNNLSGRIPIGTQLQSFNASSYEGNADLCGKPLDKKCPGDEDIAHRKPETHEESSQEDKRTLYFSVTLGFITGFWGLWGSLLLIRHWRHKYVLLLDNIIDTMHVFIVLNATKFQVWLRRLQFQPINGISQILVRTQFPHKKCGRKSFLLRPQAVPSKTQRIMESVSVGDGEVGGAGGAYSYQALKRLDQLWSNICSPQEVVQEPQQVVSTIPSLFTSSDVADKAEGSYDVIVCGGTLGIFIATALCARGLRVAVVERNVLKGREQEWNISRKELLELVEVGVLEEDDIEKVTSAKFNPNRCGFEKKGDIWVNDILNLGVSPVRLIEIVKKRFIALGGVILEGFSVSSINVYEDAAVLKLSGDKTLSSRLIIDAMGNFSPVVKQIRRGRKPDGVCLVVGTCARGFKNNSISDVIFSSSTVKKVGDSKAQYFWEAFPAGSGPLDRTTYMFTYVEPQPGSPKLEELLEEYWNLMPEYQGVPLDNLEILRVIYGIFPTYRESPLPAAFSRVLQFGDASGIQSPVSFGGFGSLTRHLGRLSAGIHEAISGDYLDSYNLSLLNPYMPNLSASWLFQRAMSAKKQSDVPEDFINELLYANFSCMQRLGDPVLRPFLQDVVQFGPLSKTLGLVMLTRPQILPSIFKQVGIPVLLDWFRHFLMLGYYTFLATFADPIVRPLLNTLPSKTSFQWKRHLEAWKYGAGLDYKL
ncbi:receptor protein EIX2 [Trifolium repens]|nr:receptor protein EIX2 [Trifolium repens]